MQVGLIVKKIGMSQVLSENGTSFPVTLLKFEKNVVIAHKDSQKHGYDALVVGAFPLKDDSKLTKPMKNAFAKMGSENFSIIKEFRVDGEKVSVGSVLDIDSFKAGDFIDISGVSVGKGFAGAMKRHNFGGLRASHGVSITHRCLGGTGQNQDPGKVFKGKKMAGHMGAKQVTVLNVPVFSVDSSLGIVVVRGSVPGSSSNFVFLRKAIKK